MHLLHSIKLSTTLLKNNFHSGYKVFEYSGRWCLMQLENTYTYIYIIREKIKKKARKAIAWLMQSANSFSLRFSSCCQGIDGVTMVTREERAYSLLLHSDGVVGNPLQAFVAYLFACYTSSCMLYMNAHYRYPCYTYMM